MDKEYYGKFLDKNGNDVLKCDCRVFLNEDKICLYSLEDEKIKFREYTADSIFSFEDEKLIKISKEVSTLPECIWAFFGAIALAFNFWLGMLIVGAAFLRVIRKPSKSYILLCKPIVKSEKSLRLFKVCGINNCLKKKFLKAA